MIPQTRKYKFGKVLIQDRNYKAFSDLFESSKKMEKNWQQVDKTYVKKNLKHNTHEEVKLPNLGPPM